MMGEEQHSSGGKVREKKKKKKKGDSLFRMRSFESVPVIFILVEMEEEVVEVNGEGRSIVDDVVRDAGVKGKFFRGNVEGEVTLKGGGGRKSDASGWDRKAFWHIGAVGDFSDAEVIDVKGWVDGDVGIVDAVLEPAGKGEDGDVLFIVVVVGSKVEDPVQERTVVVVAAPEGSDADDGAVRTVVIERQ